MTASLQSYCANDTCERFR